MIHKGSSSLVPQKTGQAGFEPATPGFGVRCSNQFELLTQILHFRLSMRSVCSAHWAKFAECNLVRGRFLIFACRIVLLLTLLAGQRNEISHVLLLLPKGCLLQDFGDDPGTDRPAPLPNRKP
jgi:hypothetical protein